MDLIVREERRKKDFDYDHLETNSIFNTFKTQMAAYLQLTQVFQLYFILGISK